jgi:hypothetical protein
VAHASLLYVRTVCHVNDVKHGRGAPNSAGRVAVIGDVGGHAVELSAALTGLGCDVAERYVPDDLVVIQVGDLVHRGPASDEVVSVVDGFLRNNQGRWVQLVGNHEAQYLAEPVFSWPESISPKSIRLLQSWFESGLMTMAACVRTAGVEVRAAGGARTRVGAGDLVVSHAGVTRGLWEELGCLPARELVDAVNALASDSTSAVWRPGLMLTRFVNMRAGTAWAEAGVELVGSWWGTEPPGFHQAHGHSSAFDWGRGSWRHPQLGQLYKNAAHIDRVARVERFDVGDQTIWGVDPGHERVAAPSWSPLTLPTVVPHDR